MIVSASVTHDHCTSSTLSIFSATHRQEEERMRTLLGSCGVDEAVVIKTCNRYEVYMHVDGTWDQSALKGAFGDDHALMRVRTDGSAVMHLFEVAASLESMIVGEHQILGQVKRALESSKRQGTAGEVLTPLFERAIRAGRRVRAETGLCQGAVSMASVAVDLAEQRAGPLAGKQALILGAGKISRMMATMLSSKGLAATFVTNRRFERAQELADMSGGRAIAYEIFREHLPLMDVVFCASSAPHPLLYRDELEWARALRTDPMAIVDVAMPPDVDREAQLVDGIDYIGLDDVRECSKRVMEQRKQHIPSAQRIVSEEIDGYKREQRLKERKRLARDISLHADSIRRAELEKLLSAHETEPHDIDAFSRAIVKRTLHNLFHNIHDLDIPMEKLADIRDLMLTPPDEEEGSD